ncbi:uncharacterized protein [Palaemon carinicauda]|uniref:uncharacterized protein n=1 Tax=Palaemon carinicauda TaxID=392227 RepID=UPI0035B5CE1F
MGKVKIKDTSQGTDSESRRLEIWRLLQENSLYIHKLETSNKCFYAVADEPNIEKLINPKVKEIFLRRNFEILDPPHLNAQRTLVVTQADAPIYTQSADDLKHDIETRNNVKVSEVIKLPNTHSTFKIKLDTVQMVRDCLVKGLLISGQSFPPKFLRQEVHVTLPQCMRCYKYDHVKKDCPKPDTYKICSVCASVDHCWTECPNGSNHKCITCSGDHPTMAARCPTRKTMVKEQAKILRTQHSLTTPTISFAQATAPKANNSTANSALPVQNSLSLQQITVMNTAIIMANLSEAVEPGTYQSMVDAFYKANGLPLVKIPTEAIKLASKVSNLLRSGPQTDSTPPQAQPGPQTDSDHPQTLTNTDDMETEDLSRKRVLSDSDTDISALINPAKKQPLPSTSAVVQVHVKESQGATALPPLPPINQTKFTLDINNADWERFKDSLDDSLSNYDEPNNVLKDKTYIDDKLAFWYRLIKEASEQYIPIKTHRILPYTKETDLKLLQFRYKQAIDQINIQGPSKHILEYIHDIQERIKIESVELINSNWDTLLNKCEISYKDPGKFWRMVGNLLGSPSDPAAYINNNNEKVYTPRDQEIVFRDFWSNIFRIDPVENRRFDQLHEQHVMAAIHDHADRIIPHDLEDLGRLDEDDSFLKPIQLQDIINIINQFQNKAPGQSKVNKTILKNLPNSMLSFLCHILNESLSMGYWPNFFKRAVLPFIGKKGKDLTSVSNYRPISLLETPGKIFEKIIKVRFEEFLDDNLLVNKNQYGFTHGKGTQLALARLYEFIAVKKSSGCGCNLISRDVSRAFDKVWHEGLKYKLLEAQLPDILTRLLCNFLDDRVAMIKIKDYVGPEFQLLSGVPQGSVLSPTLYNFYIKETPPPAEGCLQIIFADDHTQVITYPNKNKLRLQRKTVRELTKINNYERKWKITTNTNKFQLLSITVNNPPPIIIGNIRIPYTNNARILGCTFKRSGLLSHIKARINISKATDNRLKRFKGLSTKTQLRLYKSLVRPQLEYPTVIFSNISKTSMSKMQAVQNKALRRAFKEVPPYFNKILDLHQLSKLEPLNVRFHRLSQKTWDKLAIDDDDLYAITRTLSNGHTRDHNWWGRLDPKINCDPPRPRYISTG